MPDGHNHIDGSQVIYKNVTRKHSGTYVCEGSNGPGQIVKDKLKVDVLRKFHITYLFRAEVLLKGPVTLSFIYFLLHVYF